MSIRVSELSKTYQFKKVEKGFASRIKSIVSPAYETYHAVSNVSFQVEQAEMVAFIGPNGAGDTIDIISDKWESDIQFSPQSHFVHKSRDAKADSLPGRSGNNLHPGSHSLFPSRHNGIHQLESYGSKSFGSLPL